MKLEQIITLANRRVRLQFLAMERSLRATGCDLPLSVIPYNDELFDLPAKARWWKNPVVWDWLQSELAHPMMHKYQCFTIENYHYVDADICFLRDPAVVLAPYSGWIASCTEWNKPQWTYTPESQAIMSRRSSTWQRSIFNAGQFACDRLLFSEEELQQLVLRPDMIETCLRCNVHDQAGMNLLVFASQVPVTNLTLPPNNMESTWAGDYPAEYKHLWTDPSRKPYLIHWAGPTLDWDRPINEIFYSFLTGAERNEWEEQQRIRRQQQIEKYRASLSPLGRIFHDSKKIARTFMQNCGIKVGRGKVGKTGLTHGPS